ncbi:MAG: hypothetical protein ACRD8O_18175 [Bryobacteraceae bacterium]
MPDAEREQLRKLHGVSLVSDACDGAGLNRVPAGVFGFTFSPGLKDAPVFQKGPPGSFEVHKLPGGESLLVGHVRAEIAATIAHGALEIELYPQERGDAMALVTVPMSRIEHFSQHSIRESGALKLTLRSAP